MGQSLNIEIRNMNRTLANAYYHWSGYSSTAAEMTRSIIHRFYDHEPCSDFKLAVDLLQSTGAGLYSEEWERVSSIPDKRFSNVEFHNAAVDRNRGLLSVTPDGIEDTRRLEEARVTIDISKERVDFDVLWLYSPQEYEDVYGDNAIQTIREVPFDFEDMTFSQACDLPEIIGDNGDGVLCSDGMVALWIQ